MRNQLPTRRSAIASATAGCAVIMGFGAAAMPRPKNDLAGPEKALRAFLRAFENCDLPAMEAAFAPKATSFDRAPPVPGDLSLYRRRGGMPAGMRQLALTLPMTQPGPPYHRVQPDNLSVERHGDLAVAMFELDGPDNLGRRTVILRRYGERWLIVHLHASNVYRPSSAP